MICRRRQRVEDRSLRETSSASFACAARSYNRGSGWHARPPACNARANFLNNRRLARAADCKIADADDEAAERAFAEDSLSIEIKPHLHQAVVNERKRVKNPRSTDARNAVPALENHVDPKTPLIVLAGGPFQFRIADCGLRIKHPPRCQRV